MTFEMTYARDGQCPLIRFRHSGSLEDSPNCSVFTATPVKISPGRKAGLAM